MTPIVHFNLLAALVCFAPDMKPRVRQVAGVLYTIAGIFLYYFPQSG